VIILFMLHQHEGVLSLSFLCRSWQSGRPLRKLRP